MRRIPKSRRPSRGMTLLEVTSASAVLAVALLGVIGAHTTTSSRIAQANHETEAAALAQELAGLLGAVPYIAPGGGTNPLLANVTTANDADPTDLAGAWDDSSVTNPISLGLADHGEAELAAAGFGAALTPIDATTFQRAGPAAYTRYWNVVPIPDPLVAGQSGGVVVVAVVRYRVDGRFRHVSVLTIRYDHSRVRG